MVTHDLVVCNIAVFGFYIWCIVNCGIWWLQYPPGRLLVIWFSRLRHNSLIVGAGICSHMFHRLAFVTCLAICGLCVCEPFCIQSLLTCADLCGLLIRLHCYSDGRMSVITELGPVYRIEQLCDARGKAFFQSRSMHIKCCLNEVKTLLICSCTQLHGMAVQGPIP